MKRFPVLILLLGMLFLTACEKAETPLPQGVQTVRGYLQPVPFSLKRRGTHAILTASGGTMIAYAESVAVNLRLLEGQNVELEGVLEKNTDADAAPVFVVRKVLSENGAQLRPWKIPALSLSVSLPKNWKGSIKGSSASFTDSGFAVPVLTITTRKAAPPASAQPVYGPLPSPGGEVLVVGLRKATVELDAADAAWIVRIAPPSQGWTETVFTFALRPVLSVEAQTALYRTILKTVEFTAAGALSSRPATSAATVSSFSGGSTSRAQGEGAACGGVAGILCPRGLFCKITDPVSDSGVCTAR